MEEHLRNLIQHNNPQVRAAIVEVMVLHGGDVLLQTLLKVLGDKDRDVRCAAAWGLGTWEYQPAYSALEAIVADKGFRASGTTEIRAMFSAYARIGKEQALPTLARILNKKSLFGGRETPELRACAARALGAMQMAEATEQLNKAMDDKEPVVRRAVARSLMAGRK